MLGDTNDGHVVDLTTSPPALRNPAIIDIEDDEDEELKMAIALSLQQDGERQSNGAGEGAALADNEQSSHAKMKRDVEGPVEQPSSLHGWLGLDRKAMEAERLARLKRKRGEEETDATTQVRPVFPRKVRPVSPAPLRRVQRSPTPPLDHNQRGYATKATTRKEVVDATSEKTTLSSSATQLYPDGIVLKTHAPGYPTDGTISFDDLVAPAASLKSCLLSSFIWDFDWLFPHFNTVSTKFLLVMHAKYPAERQQIESDFTGIPNVKVCFPPMDGQINCMHSKLMLFFWDDRCRLVVPTANLMGFDWGVGSVMENTVWLIDLPLVDAGREAMRTRFQKSLTAFLTAQTVPKDVLKKLNVYDFGNTANVGFVHSIGGAHSGDSWKNTGHCGLGQVVKELGLAQAEPVEVDFVTSSVGSLTAEFMRCMYLAAQGDNGLTELTLRTSKTFPAKREGESNRSADVVLKAAGQDWRERFRVYFPSQQVIEASNGGAHSAGTICFSEKWFEANRFPKAAMRDCVSAREGLLMHNKIMFVMFPLAKQIESTSCMGYRYIGSANLSESAWGKLVQDRKTKQVRLSCRNWESGIVIPVPASGGVGLGNNRSKHQEAQQGLAAFSDTMSLPMKVPGEKYESSSRKPWFFANG